MVVVSTNSGRKAVNRASSPLPIFLFHFYGRTRRFVGNRGYRWFRLEVARPRHPSSSPIDVGKWDFQVGSHSGFETHDVVHRSGHIPANRGLPWERDDARRPR